MVIATPFDLGTDHEAMAASASEKLLAALSAVAIREDYPMTLPIFGVGHSLGAKLQVRDAARIRPLTRPLSIFATDH